MCCYQQTALLSLLSPQCPTMSRLALLSSVLVAATLANPDMERSQQFQQWQRRHGVEYRSQVEAEYRLAVFTSNMEDVEAHNRGNISTYTRAANKWSDLTQVLH